jgi:fumarate reductase flavoprotein subunit
MQARTFKLKQIEIEASEADLSFSRRTLLRGAAAATVLSAMPWSLRQSFAQESFDLIVIGAGTAGIPAAIFAADRGARVVVIEKAPAVGGTLYLSGGMIAGANTVFQKAKGIEDSPDAHYEDVMRINNNTSDPVLTRLWADNGGASINWLAENGFTVADDQPVTGTMYDRYSIPRYQWGPANGVSILNVIKPLLDRHVQVGRITVLTEAGAVDLIKDGRNAVTGVVTEDSKGKRSDVRGTNVVIASGGCAANPTMFENLHGLPLYRQVAYPYSQGAGLSLGLGAGGYLRGAENYVGYYGSIAADDGIPSAPAANMSIDPKSRMPWEVFVNARGERFVREDHPSVNARDRIMDLQPGHRFWALFDQQILDEAPALIPDWSREKLLAAFNTHPMFARAVSLSELGVITGIDPSGIERSIRDYNLGIEKDAPDAFGRTHRPLPVSRPPFYAIRSQTWTLKSYAGLAVNKDLQVITREGEPVSNLYAAGEVLGAATSGRSHTSGASVTPALAFGRLLGKEIIRF